MTPEELLVELDQAGCDEAVLTASVFIRALVIEPDFFAAWHLVDTETRRNTTGAFLEAIAATEGLNHDEAQRTADDLAELGAEHDLWLRFAHAALLSWQAIFNVDFERWGYVTRSRPIGLDLETVYLAEVGQDAVSHRAEALQVYFPTAPKPERVTWGTTREDPLGDRLLRKARDV